MSSESGIFHHLPCFQHRPSWPAVDAGRLASPRSPSIVTTVSCCACLASSPTPGVLYSAAVPPPVLSSPRSYRLSHLLAPLKGRPAIAAPATCCKTRRDHPEPPSIRRNFNRNQPEYWPRSLILLRLSHRSAESPSPALCTFVALDCSDLSLSSSNCALSHDRRDTPSHRLAF